MSLTIYKIRKIKSNPENYTNTDLKKYLKYKKIKGISQFKRGQLLNLISAINTKKDKNIKITKKQQIDNLINSEKETIQLNKQKNIIKRSKNRREETIKKFKEIDNKFKRDEINKYTNVLNNIIQNNVYSWDIREWTKINKPKYNSWEDILKLFTTLVNNGNMLFIGDIEGDNNFNEDDYLIDEYGNILEDRRNNNINKVIWVITQNNKRNFNHVVNKIIKGEEIGGSRSDAYIEEVVLNRTHIYINLVTKKPKTKRLVKGGFFKYFHNLPIDLSRYQIYRKDQIEDINYEPCLIYCLRMAGISENIINKAKKYIKVDFIPLKTIKKVASKINVAINIYDSDKNKYYSYNEDAKTKITVNLYDEHYFISDSNTNITKYALSNFDELKNIEGFNNIYRKTEKGYYKRTEDRYITSNNLVKYLVDNKEKHLTEILDEIDIKNRHNEEKQEELEFDDDECILNEYKEKKDISDVDLVFFDFETTTDEEIHKPYLICANKFKMINDKYESIETKTFFGAECGLKFLQWINNNSVLLAHNLKYDFQFIMKHLFSINLTERNNKIMGGKVRFYNLYTGKTHKLILRDTYLMISKKLRDFPNMFFSDEEKKEIKKEILPYSLYNKSTVDKDCVLIEDALKELKEEDKKEFMNNLDKWNLINGDYFDHIEYANIYCKQDVNVMQKGYFKFREWIRIIAGVDIIRYLTISSIADDYLVKEGCYEDCYKFNGNVRTFIQKCVVGGRCMIRDNKKLICNERVQDFDAVSLYPSAMAEMGFLKGKPKIINNTNFETIKNHDGYFLKINVTKINKQLHFPIINRVNNKGIREFDNNLIGEHYVDKTTLEDLIKYQDIEFEVIKGYYFDEGRNYKIQECIRKLFNERKEQKKRKNLIQEVYKLLMNSCYGKTILKEQDKVIIYKDTEEDAIKYIMRNCDYVCEFNKINDSTKYRVKILETTDDLYTSPHIGAEILSMSKRIMNRVMCLAEEIGCIINYQDTDSMHILERDIDKLEKEYQKRYNKTLIGSDLGQFHCDFEVGQDNGTTPVSIESIYCAKKIYMDKISCTKNNKESIEYHLRCKGVPKKSLEKVCNENYNNNYIELFKNIYDGKTIMFDLLASGVKFKFNKDFTVSNIVEFKRKLKI